MSDLLFDRQIEVTIGKRGQAGTQYTDLRVEFKVEKTLESKPSKGFVKVYNLTKDNRSKAEQTGNVLILRAGYGKNLSNIFTGDVARAKTELEGVDYITTFELGDGELMYQTSKSELSFAKGTDIQTALKGIFSNVGAVLGDITGLKSEKLNAPLVLSGNVRKHLDEIGKRQGFEWSIQDEAFQILEKGKPTKDEAILLSSETGLIGIPKNKFGKDPTEKGIEFDSLLNPKLKPGRRAVIESKIIQGVYRIEKVTFQGDNYGTDFLSKCEASPIR